MTDTFQVRRLDCDEEWTSVKAWDDEEAAESYCEDRYSDWEYPSGPLEIEVMDSEEVTTLVLVSVEAQPVFRGETARYEPARPCWHIRDPQRALDDKGMCFACRNVVGPTST